MDERTASTVLLIHGTFGADEADDGPAWWQRGSEFHQALRQRLPPHVKLPEHEAFFHWSGENSEWARYQAGKRLLERLRHYESQGRRYHLVAHSHGGTVIWHALRLATRRKIHLKRLQSWATVGTPFLHFRPVASLLNALLLGGLCWALAALVLSVAIVHVEPWIREHLPSFHLVAVIGGGMWIAGGAAFLVYAGLRGLYSVAEARRAIADRRVARRAMRLYGARWLGLWSSEDEAIGGLRHSVDFRMQLLTRHGTLATELPFLSERPVARVCFRATAKLANVSFIPTLRDVFFQSIDEEVCAVLSGLCQGNNRPGTVVEKVTAGPVPADHHAYPHLPASVDEAIVRTADGVAARTIGKVRRAFGQIAMGGPEWKLAPLSEALSGKELVHTSYFDVPGVLQLLCWHIAEHTRHADLQLLAARMPAELLEWYRVFGAAVRGHVLDRLTATPRPARVDEVRVTGLASQTSSPASQAGRGRIASSQSASFTRRAS